MDVHTEIADMTLILMMVKTMKMIIACYEPIYMYLLFMLNEPVSMAQLLSHLLTVLGLHLVTGSNPEQVFKGPIGRCKATTPSSLSLTLTTNKIY